MFLAAARVGGIHANSTYSADFIVDNAPHAQWFGRPAVIAVVGIPEALRNQVQPAFNEFQDRRFDEVSQNLLPGPRAL